MATPQAVAALTTVAAVAVTTTVAAANTAAVMHEFGGRLLDWVDDGLHANSRSTTRPTVGYTLRDADTGEVKKIGQTTRPGSRYSARYLRNNNVIMRPEAVGSKADMLAWEKEQIENHKEVYGQRPAMNKVDRE